jgi:hypothetical protein
VLSFTEREISISHLIALQNSSIFAKSKKYRKSIEPQGIERGRTLTRISSVAKYGGGAQAGANFRGRKSNSLMNLCGGKNESLTKIIKDKHFSCDFKSFALLFVGFYF